jgi:hypothetical protein
MAHDEELKAKMAKALEIAKDCLKSAGLLTAPGIGISAKPSPGEPNPDALPIAILTAELFKHIPSLDVSSWAPVDPA